MRRRSTLSEGVAGVNALASAPLKWRPYCTVEIMVIDAAEVAEFGRLVGSVPALHDALEAFRPVLLAVTPEPFGLD